MDDIEGNPGGNRLCVFSEGKNLLMTEEKVNLPGGTWESTKKKTKDGNVQKGPI